MGWGQEVITKVDPDEVGGENRWPEAPDQTYVQREVILCMTDPFYFVTTYCSVYAAADAAGETTDPTAAGGKWVPFHLWPAQRKPLRLFHTRNKVIALKARQLGLTWLALAYALWTMLFRDRSTTMLFSRRDTEALDLLRRLKGMAIRLPDWLLPVGMFDAKGRLTGSSGHSWTWPDGGRVMAFPCTAGDSYTATLVVIDEADLVPNLNALLSAVKPTIDNGGKMLLISKSYKSKPESPFKNLYRAATAGDIDYGHCFMPWYAHPKRTWAWYEEQARQSQAQTFSLDDLWENYPATADEALAANQYDKRFPEAAVRHVYHAAQDLCVDPAAGRRVRPCVDRVAEGWDFPDAAHPPPGVTVEPHPDDPERLVRLVYPAPAIPGLRVYAVPRVGGRYSIGADPSQGLPTSNDSPLVAIDDVTGEEVACVRGRFAPKVLARYSAELAEWYSRPADAKCGVMIERNNHGHACILWWESNRAEYEVKARLLKGHDGQYGWDTKETAKELMYHRVAQRVTDGRLIVHSADVFAQLKDVEAATLCAPEPHPDDLAVALGLAVVAADLRKKTVWEIKELGVP